MTRRHRGEDFTGVLLASTGGGGGGGCGLLLLLVFVAVIVKYWWVVALVIGAAVAIWFGVRAIREEARAARLAGTQHPLRPISTKAPKRKKELPLSGDALTAKLRADKRRQRMRDMEGWNREWAQLLGSAAPSYFVSSPRADGKRRSFAVGQSVVVLKRIPANPGYPAQAEPGDSGIVTHVGSPSRVPGLRSVQVRLGRTGELVTVLEKDLACPPAGPRGR